MAPPIEPPTTITLRIKVQSGEELTLGNDIPINTRVGEVRQRIQEAVPSHPPPERQRLIHAGRALVDNEQSLADALTVRRDTTQTEYVVHLVIRGDGAGTAPIPSHGRGASTSNTNQSANPPQTTPPALGEQQGLPHHHPVHHHHPVPIDPQHAAMLAQHQQQHFRQMMQTGFPPLHMPGQVAMPFGPQPFGGLPPMQPFPGHLHPPGMAPHPHMPQPSDGVAPTDGTADREAPRAQQAGGQPRSASQPPPTPLPGNVRGYTVVHHQTFSAMPPPPQPRPGGPSQLDQARGNIAEMRHMLDELRNLDIATDDQRRRIGQLEQRTQALNDYIDPFRLGQTNRPTGQPATGAPADLIPGLHERLPRPNSQPPPAASWTQRLQDQRQAQMRQLQSTNPTDVTCYLLSSPTGPQALLYSPQHGTYRGGRQQQTNAFDANVYRNTALTTALPRPTPTTAAPDPNQQAAQVQVQGQAAPAQPAQQQQAAAAAQDGLGPLGPLMNNVWLLLRMLIFSYFLLGTNMGWRRPLALGAIAVGFYLVRQGLLNDGGALRRWWDGIVNDGRPAPRQIQGGAQGQQGEGQGEGQQGQQAAAGNARPVAMPTAQQVAQRLLDEDQRIRNERFRWIREQIRPVERAVALLVASLWPGVGEAYVRAREAEERRLAEEEIAARRREEEEKQKKEEEEKKQAEEGAEGSEVKDKTEASPPAEGPSAEQDAIEKAVESEKTEAGPSSSSPSA